MNTQLAQELEVLLNTLQQTEAIIMGVQPGIIQTTGEVHRIIGDSQKGIDKRMVGSLNNAIHSLAEAHNAVSVSVQAISQLRATI
ncbi:hypothetical protein [Corynebacterium freiburgense]|uniref:hypothetical protein n=1 Tax=Corynebacterium freiburgense TaxID=556548 RepID=UPI0012EBCEAC|nr:hypothetical protein [Corynebacterium freiburgense]